MSGVPEAATHAARSGRLRTFVALRPSAEARAALNETRTVLSRRLRDGGFRARIGWVPEERLHLTLLFLGDLGADARTLVTRAAVEAATTSRPFVWGVGAPGAFPSTARPRVLWAGVTPGAEEVAALRSRLVERLAAHGVRTDDEGTFVPHVTLGRVRGRGAVRDADPAVFAPQGERPPATTRATRVETFVSESGPIGIVHRVVGTAVLGGSE